MSASSFSELRLSEGMKSVKITRLAQVRPYIIIGITKTITRIFHPRVMHQYSPGIFAWTSREINEKKTIQFTVCSTEYHKSIFGHEKPKLSVYTFEPTVSDHRLQKVVINERSVHRGQNYFDLASELISFIHTQINI